MIEISEDRTPFNQLNNNNNSINTADASSCQSETPLSRKEQLLLWKKQKENAKPKIPSTKKPAGLPQRSAVVMRSPDPASPKGSTVVVFPKSNNKGSTPYTSSPSGKGIHPSNVESSKFNKKRRLQLEASHNNSLGSSHANNCNNSSSSNKNGETLALKESKRPKQAHKQITSNTEEERVQSEIKEVERQLEEDTSQGDHQQQQQQQQQRATTASIEALKREVNELKAKLIRANDEFDSILKEQQLAQEKQISELERENFSLHAQSSQYQARIEELQAQVTSQQEMIASLQAKLETATKQASEAQRSDLTSANNNNNNNNNNNYDNDSTTDAAATTTTTTITTTTATTTSAVNIAELIEERDALRFSNEVLMQQMGETRRKYNARLQQLLQEAQEKERKYQHDTEEWNAVATQFKEQMESSLMTTLNQNKALSAELEKERQISQQLRDEVEALKQQLQQQQQQQQQQQHRRESQIRRPMSIGGSNDSIIDMDT